MEPEHQNLERKIFELKRNNIEKKDFAYKDFSRLCSGITWERISRLSNFWEDKSTNTVVQQSLEKNVANWSSGLYGKNRPLFSFVLCGKSSGTGIRGGEIECWFGMGGIGVSKEAHSALQAEISAIMPDARFQSQENSNALTTAQGNGISSDWCPQHLKVPLPYSTLFTGTPSSKAVNNTHEVKGAQIERLCRALCGADWMYMVVASPYNYSDIQKDVVDISNEIKRTRTHFLQDNTTIGQSNRLAEEYVELLEKKLERWKVGSTCGMWKTWRLLSASTMQVLEAGQSMLLTAYSGEESLPDKCRTHRIFAESNNNLLHMEAPDLLPPITSKELSTLICPPLEEYPGYEIVPEARFGVEPNQHFLPEHKPLTIGAIQDRGRFTGTNLCIKAKDLTKHGLIVGVTGAGKTNTCFTILERTVEAGIPFMVIESAKSEYRSLLKSPVFKNLRVFTVGDENISPLRLNPFEVPDGILLQSHIDYLQALFGAAFVLYPPLPYVLAMSIQKIYEDKGWDLTANVNLRGSDSARAFPTIDDLIATVPMVSDSLGYVGETRQNIKSSLEGRLTQLRIGGGKGAMLNCRQSISADELFKTPCIIELKQLVNDADKAFLIGLLLIRLCEYYEGNKAPNNGELRHLTLIEEAHRLLRNVSTTQGGDTANPLGKAVEVFTNMLAEIRAYGEGIFMAEQIPTKLAPEALKNTNLKIIQRLVAKDDKDAVGATMGLDEEQKDYLTRLKTGEAVSYMEGLEKAVLIKIPASKAKENVFIEENEIKKAMKSFWDSHPSLLNGNSICSSCEERGKCISGIEINDSQVIQAATVLCNNMFFSNDYSLTLRYREKILNIFNSYKLSANINEQFACFLMRFAERHAGKIADFYNWPHKYVEHICDETVKLIFKYANAEVDETEFIAQKIFELWEDAFGRNSMSKGEGLIYIRPLSTCSYCRKNCTFRPLFASNIDERNLKQYISKTNEINLDYALQLAENAVGNYSLPLLKDAAYCVCAHITERMSSGLPEKKSYMLKARIAIDEINSEIEEAFDQITKLAEQFISAIIFQGPNMVRHTGTEYAKFFQRKLFLVLYDQRFDLKKFATNILQQRIQEFSEYFRWPKELSDKLFDVSLTAVDYYCNYATRKLRISPSLSWSKAFKNSTFFEHSQLFDRNEYDVWAYIPLMKSVFSTIPVPEKDKQTLKKIITSAESKIARTEDKKEIVRAVIALFPEKGKNSIESHPLAKQINELLQRGQNR